MKKAERTKIGPKAKKQDLREQYEPPRVTYTEISVNEALMGICKGGLGAGPYGPGCPGGCSGGGS
ncbi:MAG: hypothetical protein JRJ87_06680 [Deltaproteobacteria bacterium]|nr:hypothetical protein [Deltaproteobacteria bacterium]